MSRVILHLGMPRTGSTSLQHVWVRHREALQRLGILYPDLRPASESRRHINHQCLGEAVHGRRPRSELEELFGQLERALRSGADTVIVSHEMLAHRDPRRPAIARLLDLLRREGAVVEPLAVVKSPAEAANSSYTLRCLFLGEQLDFRAYLRTLALRFRLDLPRRLLPWRDACGTLTALPLRDQEDSASLVERVWRAAGIMDRAGHLLDAGDLSRRENASPGPVAIEASRRLTASGACRRRDEDGRREVTRAIEAAARAAGADRESFRGYDATEAAALDARWAARNERFARAAWGRPWAARVAPPPMRPANDLARTANADGLRQVEATLAAVCSRLGLPGPGPVRDGMLPRLLRRLPL